MNTTEETRTRAARIASTLGNNHRTVNFDLMYDATKTVIENATGFKAKFKKDGGSDRSDLLLQNIQARERMVLSYAMAGTELEIAKKEGFLLVLAAGNLD